MRGFRITPLLVAIIGTVLCIGAAAGIYFGLIKPTSEQIAEQQTRYNANASYTGGPPLADAKKKLAAAQAQAESVKSQWAYIEQTHNPPIDVSDRFRGWLQWTSELEFDFAPRVQKFLNHTGVTPLTKITAPAPPADPNAVPTTLIAMPLGTITVFGSYNQILNHAAAWNRFDRVVMIDKLALQGYSPFVTGSYAATEFIFPRNGDKPGPPVPSASGGPGAQPPTASARFEDQPGFGSKSPFK